MTKKNGHNHAQPELFPDTFRPPRVEFPAVRVPQPDGSILMKPGKAVVVGDEIGTAEFARRTGISQRHVQYLCEVGDIEARPLTDRPGSKYMIPTTEVDRIRNLKSEDLK